MKNAERVMSSKINRIVSCVPSMLDGGPPHNKFLVFSPSSRPRRLQQVVVQPLFHHSQSRLTLNYM